MRRPEEYTADYAAWLRQQIRKQEEEAELLAIEAAQLREKAIIRAAQALRRSEYRPQEQRALPGSMERRSVQQQRQEVYEENIEYQKPRMSREQKLLVGAGFLAAALIGPFVAIPIFSKTEDPNPKRQGFALVGGQGDPGEGSVPNSTFYVADDGLHGCPLKLEPGQKVIMTQAAGVGSHDPLWKWGGPDLAVDGNGDNQADPEYTDGRPVLAMNDGVVHIKSRDGEIRDGVNWGNGVIVEGEQWTSEDWHLKTITVTEGEQIKAGGQVGTVGSTGVSTGPHLHINERKNGGGMLDMGERLVDECNNPQPQQEQKKNDPVVSNENQKSIDFDANTILSDENIHVYGVMLDYYPGVDFRNETRKLLIEAANKFGIVPKEPFVVEFVPTGNNYGGKSHNRDENPKRQVDVNVPIGDGASIKVLRRYLMHEMFHILEDDGLGKDTGDILLNEGLATWVTGEYWTGGGDFKSYVQKHGIQPLLTEPGDDGGLMDLMYPQWASFIDFLVKKDNGDLSKFKKLYKTSHGGLISADYQGVYGKSFNVLEDEWEKWVMQ